MHVPLHTKQKINFRLKPILQGTCDREGPRVGFAPLGCRPHAPPPAATNPYTLSVIVEAKKWILLFGVKVAAGGELCFYVVLHVGLSGLNLFLRQNGV